MYSCIKINFYKNKTATDLLEIAIEKIPKIWANEYLTSVQKKENQKRKKTQMYQNISQKFDSFFRSIP